VELEEEEEEILGGGGWWLYDQKGLGTHVPLCVAMFMTTSQNCS